MTDDNSTQDQDTIPGSNPTLQTPEIPTSDTYSPTTGFTNADSAPVAPEAPPDAPTPLPVKDDNSVPETPASQSENTSNSVASATVPATSFLHDLLTRARAKIQWRKQRKLDKILEKLTIKNKISNDDVQKLLYVSDATATRYLSTLEQQGKIKQSGRTGKYTFYTKI